MTIDEKIKIQQCPFTVQKCNQCTSNKWCNENVKNIEQVILEELEKLYVPSMYAQEFTEYREKVRKLLGDE